MTPITQQFVLFALVGAAGFVVDAGALYGAMTWLDVGIYAGRLFSFACAVTFTWAANRLISFKHTARMSPGRQWLRFVVANSIGAVVNFATYVAVVSTTSIGAAWPIIGVAVGSLAGLAFNFGASRAWVFR